ncbi:unnamed protein product [Fusarium graminearum]|uniref:Uncharacterized protein n=1 Tax=Gibberella zeae TaxID=5518 RepID=A0A4E9DUB0_GIBZA|nr:unnamed protein product [Fusarium graminearum]
MPLLGLCLQAFAEKLSTSGSDRHFSFRIIHEATICQFLNKITLLGEGSVTTASIDDIPECRFPPDSERVEYKDLDSAQKQLSEILHTVKQDPTLKDISHLGSEGIYHCLITDRHVVNAIPLTSPLIKDLVGQLPYSEESENKFHGVNGTRSGSKKARSALCWVMV